MCGLYAPSLVILIRAKRSSLLAKITSTGAAVTHTLGSIFLEICAIDLNCDYEGQIQDLIVAL